MKRLELPDVTLVMLETQEHELARLAVEECLDKVQFGDALIFTDDETKFYALGNKFFNGQGCTVKVPNWPTKLGWSQASWYDVPPLLRTSHALFIQWDSWVWDLEKWNDEFLRYDYIGAPWWYQDGKNVGNGGFSLRSTALCRYLLRWRDKIPCVTPADDDLLCRSYRRALENDGFEWAPEEVARDFAMECVELPADMTAWGFHGAFNFNRVLDEEKLRERAQLICASPYIKRTSHIWNSFTQKNPQLVAELTREAA